MARQIMHDETTQPIPRCPECDAELPILGLFNWAVGVWMILSVYCPACQKVLHMQVLPMMPAEEQRIQRPS
jgi:hypothetical protein